MNTDIRLSINFWTHPKTVKLERRLGLEGVRSLQILWLWAARNRADGRLSKLDAEAIEIVADWRGANGKFVETALELVWLEEDDEGYRIHDWQEHNGWAAGADKRGDRARLGKLIQRRPDLAETLKNQGVTGVSPEEYRRLVDLEDERQAEREPAGCLPQAGYKQAASKRQAEREQTGSRLQALAPAPAPSPAPSPSPSPMEEKDFCAERLPAGNPSTPPEPYGIDIPLVDGSTYTVTEADVAQWQDAFPAVDVPQELREIRSWSDANPRQRKTRKGIRRCINAWLSKEQDKNDRQARASPPGDNRPQYPQPMTPRQRYMQDVANMIGTFEEAKRNGDYDLINFPAPTATSVDAPVRPVEPTRRALPGGGS